MHFVLHKPSVLFSDNATDRTHPTRARRPHHRHRLRFLWSASCNMRSWPEVWFHTRVTSPPVSSWSNRIKIWQLDESNGSWRVQDEWKVCLKSNQSCRFFVLGHWRNSIAGAWGTSVKNTLGTPRIWFCNCFLFVWPYCQSLGTSFCKCSSWYATVSECDCRWWRFISTCIALVGKECYGGVQRDSTWRWICTSLFRSQTGMAVWLGEFWPAHLFPKATISTDNVLRVYECVDQSSLTTWQLLLDIDVLNLPTTSSTPTFHSSRQHTIALSTPTQTTATLDLKTSNNFADHAQALSQGLAQNAALNNQAAASRHTINNREADGGWCLSWCKDRYWGEILAVGAATSGVIKVIWLSFRIFILFSNHFSWDCSTYAFASTYHSSYPWSITFHSFLSQYTAYP